VVLRGGVLGNVAGTWRRKRRLGDSLLGGVVVHLTSTAVGNDRSFRHGYSLIDRVWRESGGVP
jgi:hypothetical protein